MAIDNITEKCLKRLDSSMEDMTLEDKLQKIGVRNLMILCISSNGGIERMAVSSFRPNNLLTVSKIVADRPTLFFLFF